MRRVLTAACAAALTTACTVALGPAAMAATPAHHGHDRDDASKVSVRSDGMTVHLSRARLHAGRVAFTVSTTSSNGSEVAMFRPTRGSSAQKVLADLAEEFAPDPATDAKGTRDLTRDARFYGLADVAAGVPATVTETLQAGRYYLLDVAAAQSGSAPALVTLDVVGRSSRHEHGDDDRRLPTILTTSADRFVSPARLPAHGTVRIRNVADTLHFVQFQPVAPGTTDAQIQAYFDSGAQTPPPFLAPGPSVGADVLSPGRSLELSYNLPRGTYVLLCFVADDQTGMPHALMGMHKVVVLH